MGQYFRLNGLTGFLIAVALLLTILFVLVTAAIGVQKSTATDYYKIKDAQNIEMINPDSGSHLVNAAK